MPPYRTIPSNEEPFILTFGRNCYRFLSYQLFHRSALNYFDHLEIGLKVAWKL